MDNEKYVFFRDDDVSVLDETFLRVHNLFVKERMPIVYAVIPGKLEKDMTGFLLREKQKHPKLIHIVQHGWMHKNHDSQRKKYEFGDKRTMKEQESDIKRGRDVMLKAFGDYFTQVFIPPFHGYNSNTLEIISKLGMKGVSVPVNKDILHSGFCYFNIPISITLNPEQDMHTLSLMKSIAKFIRSQKTEKTTGILIHHQDMNEKSVEKLKLFIRFVKKMKHKYGFRFKSFTDIADSLNRHKEIGNITIEITNKCNLRCTMCSIWKEKEMRLSISEIKEIISSLPGRISVSLTGGECFLHPDFDRIYKQFFLFHKKKKVQNIDITTNGFDTKKIMNFISDNKYRLAPLLLSISIDGTEKTHDMQRGITGCYEKTLATIKGIRKKYPKIPVGIKMVITPVNYTDIFNVFMLARRLGCSFEPKLVEENKEYYNRKGAMLDAEFSESIKREIISDLKKVEEKEEDIYRKRIIECLIKYLKTRKLSFIKKCITPKKALFISSKGKVYPCLYYKPIGNIREAPLLEILRKKDKIESDAFAGRCLGCLSYHGYLKDFNIIK